MSTSTFFALGLVIAIGVIIEALSLQKNEGRFTKLFIFTTIFEFVWVLVCVYALFTISFPSWSIIIPAGYISYFVVATWHTRGMTEGIESIDDLKTIQAPTGMVKISLLAGVILFILNCMALTLI
ncbi:hypothetical protein [Leucothrix arctica]|uniref:Uncharacterized protein n=1 Tax=Leucothrix arctica TaxID=1481894 RepID=A0A317CDG7_9GAMM|nr:hypothetical protein [Leucothrix arctica]PWQ96151.1 hypothetical protein DKT75_09140 [Leucothrix arctica]